jgi:hypothetical protein
VHRGPAKEADAPRVMLAARAAIVRNEILPFIFRDAANIIVPSFLIIYLSELPVLGITRGSS